MSQHDHFASIGLPFGLLLTVVVRSRPLGLGMTLWTRQVQEEAKVVRGNKNETVRKAA